MEEESEFKKLPVDERCVHKLWKARVNGYEEATKLFRQIDDEKSPEWSKYLGLIKKFVTDSNALGQEKGLEAALAFVENCGHAGKTVGEVMSGIVTKCIAAPKTKTKELAVQVTLMYVEIEKHEAVLEELLKGMEQKNPKIVAACVSATTLALQEFGSKVVAIKPLVKKIPVLLSDRDKTIRDEGKAMVVEMFRWVGAALRPQLASLQPVQVTELETEFDKVKGTPTPARYLRSQQQRQAKIAAKAAEISDPEDDDQPDAAIEVDPYDLMEPVDILSKLPKDFYDKIEAKKWQERKEAVECLETLLKAPKLESGDYGDVVRALKKIITKDSNVNVIALAGKCMAALATGLKKRYQPYAGACVPALLEKFREKKTNVVTALREAIDAVFMATTVEAILEDVIVALNNKNPAVKMETASFLSRAFCRIAPIALNKKMLKAYVTELLKTLNEPDPSVRDASAEAVGTAMKLVGEKQIMPFLMDVDALKMAKIKECCDKATILVKVQGVKKERPSTAPPKGEGSSRSAGSTAAKPVKRPATSNALKKKNTTSASAPTVTAGKNKIGGRSTKAASERDLSMEEVDEKAAECLPSDCLLGMGDVNWKTRLAALEQFNCILNDISPKEVSTQVMLRTIVKKPGLKDTNFQVLRMRLEAIKHLAETFPFSNVTADYCLADVTDKLGDAKNGALAAEVLTAIAEATKLEFVSNEAMSFAFNQKNPKVQQEILLWLSSAIKEFGFTINIKSTIDQLRKAMSATSPAVRTAAITLVGTMYLYMGPTVVSFFENEKPGLRQQIEAEIDKYRDEKAPVPSKGISKSSSRNSMLEEDDDEEVSQSSTNTNDAMQRVDISMLITEMLINELADKNWKVRMEALTKIQSIITDAKLIGPNIADLPTALAPRLSDSNSKIAQTTIMVCELLATAMGSPCKQHVRTLFPGFLQGLGDSKTWIRTASISCINTWGEQVGYKEFLDGEMIADALKTGSPTMRIELWGWLAEKLPNIKPKSFPKEELMACLPHLYTNLEDRNADVRKNAQEAVLGIMIHLGYDCMMKNSEKLKRGSRTVVVAALDKARPSLPMKPLPAKSKPEEATKSIKSGSRPSTVVKATAKSKAGAAKVAPTSRKKDEDVDTSPLLAVNSLKHQRSLDEQKLKVLKWNFVTPREEFVDLLRDQMTTANVNKSLMANMFHSDFRYHLKALESLTEDLQDNSDALIANLDLILKWLTLRFFDTNPSVLLKGLEYLQTVFGLLVDTQHNLSDSEASSFIPYLILKVGDPKDAVRNGVRGLFKQIALSYPVSKLFMYIMDGLKSKNARQRTECLDELGSLIEDYGMCVCQPTPAQALREVAKQISDRDNSVRNAALNCVVQAYRIEGEKVYRLVGQISDKDLSLLEERIKRAAKTRVVKPVAAAPPQMIVSPSRGKRESVYVEPEPEPMDEEEPEPAPPITTRFDSAATCHVYESDNGYHGSDTMISVEQRKACRDAAAVAAGSAASEGGVNVESSRPLQAASRIGLPRPGSASSASRGVTPVPLTQDVAVVVTDEGGRVVSRVHPRMITPPRNLRVNVADRYFKNGAILCGRTPEMNAAEEEHHVEVGSGHNGPSPTVVKVAEPALVSGPFGLDMDLIERLEMEPVHIIKPKLRQMDLDFLYDDSPRVPLNPSIMPISPPKRIVPSEHFMSMSGSSSLNQIPLNKVQLPPIPGQQEHLLERTIAEIASPDLNVALQAITQMEDILRSTKANLMTAYEDNFMSVVLQQMKALRQMNIQNPETLKAYRACLTVLVAFYESKVVGRQISRDILKGMLEQLIGLLTDKQLASLTDADVYTKVINTLCVRLIERSDHTNITCALIKLLHDCSPQGVVSQRYVDLVMKCLWKVVKLIPSWSEEIDYDLVLLEMHVFFSHFPSSWWKQQPTDTPGRTIKTVLHAMAKIKGQNILTHMLRIPNPNNSELYTYLVKILRTLQIEESKQVPTLQKDPAPRPLSRAMHNLLSDIFQKIGSKKTTKEGLLLLYEFHEQHPEADIEPFLKRSSKIFQEYIEKGLEDIAAQKRKYESRNQSNETDLVGSVGHATTMESPERWLERLRNLETLAANPTSGATLLSDENLNSTNIRSETDVESLRRRLEHVKSRCHNDN